MEWVYNGEICRQTGKFSKTKLQHPHSVKWHSQSITSHFLFAYTYIQYYVSEVCYWAGCECMDKVCYLQLRRWGKTEKHSPQLRLNHGPIARMGLCEVMKLQRIVACWSWPEIVSLSINRVEWISQWELTAHVHVYRSCVLEAGTSNHIKSWESKHTCCIFT